MAAASDDMPVVSRHWVNHEEKNENLGGGGSMLDGIGRCSLSSHCYIMNLHMAESVCLCVQ